MVIPILPPSLLVIPSTFAPDNPQAIDQDVDKLGKPKPGQSGKDPPQGKLGEGEARAAQGQANQGKQDPKVKEAGKGAKKGVVGEAAMAKNPGVWPPKDPKNAPTAGGAATKEVQIWREKEAS